jgi:hypothetical protein
MRPIPRRPNPKWDDPEESQRFLDAAEAADSSEDAKEFERVLIKAATREFSRSKARGVS